MSLHLIVGPMFAGKTSAIQSVVRRYTSIGKTTLVLTADIDTRYQESADAVINHDRSSVSATAIHVDHLAGVLVTDALLMRLSSSAVSMNLSRPVWTLANT